MVAFSLTCNEIDQFPASKSMKQYKGLSEVVPAIFMILGISVCTIPNGAKFVLVDQEPASKR